MIIQCSGNSSLQLLDHVAAVKRTTPETQNLASPISVSSSPILFNYLGMQSSSSSGKLFETDSIPHGSYDDINNIRNSLLDVESYFEGGQAHLAISFADTIFTTAEMETLLRLWSRSILSVLQKPQRHNGTAHGVAEYSQWTDVQENTLLANGIQASWVEYVHSATDNQSAMFFASLEDGSYSTSYDYTVNGDIDEERFKEAWNTVLSRHSMFRTVFVLCSQRGHEHNSRLLQVVLRSEHSPVVQSLSSCQSPVTDGTILTKVSFSRSCSNQLQFTWNIHPSLIDGWSTRIVLEQVKTLYQHGHLDSVCPQFHQIAAEVQERLDTSLATDFWQRMIQGASATDMTDSTRNGSETISKTRLIDHSTAVSLAELTNRCLEVGLTPTTILRAVMAITLAHYSGHDDSLFGVTSPGRSADVWAIESTVGPFINTVPVRLPIIWDESIHDLIERVGQVSANISEHDSLSLHQIQRVADMNDLTNVVMDFRPPAKTSAINEPYTLNINNMRQPTDVLFFLKVGTDRRSKIALYLFVTNSKLSDSFVRRFAQSYGLILKSMISQDHNTRVKDLPYVDNLHLETLQRLSTGSVYPASKDKPIWTLFKHQALETPTDPALEFSNGTQRQTLTYDQLY